MKFPEWRRAFDLIMMVGDEKHDLLEVVLFDQVPTISVGEVTECRPTAFSKLHETVPIERRPVSTRINGVRAPSAMMQPIITSFGNCTPTRTV